MRVGRIMGDIGRRKERDKGIREIERRQGYEGVIGGGGGGDRQHGEAVWECRETVCTVRRTVERQCVQLYILQRHSVYRHCRETLWIDSFERHCGDTFWRYGVERQCGETAERKSRERQRRDTMERDSIHCKKG